MKPETTTPVLITGGGLTGLSMSLFLSQHQISHVLIERHPGTSIHPRARGLRVRAMELMRQVGLEGEIRQAGRTMTDNRGFLNAKTLAEADLTTGLDGEYARQVYKLMTQENMDELSPTAPCGCTQDEIEPVMLEAARHRGGKFLFNTELVSSKQHPSGVTATVMDRTTGTEKMLHAQYLIAADGANSPVRHSLDIPMSGRGSMTHQINMLFEADLSKLLNDYSFSICNIQNEFTSGTLATVGNKHRFTYHVNYHPEQGETIKDFTNDRCLEIIRHAIGLPRVNIKLLSVLPWEAAIRIADSFQQGRVFLVGDSAHIMPPTGGYGGNTGIQDAHNLAWKIAMVLQGHSDSGLLESYDTERRPIARFTAEQAGLMAATGVFNINKTSQQEENDSKPAGDEILSLGYHYDSHAIIQEGAQKTSTEKLILDGRPGTRAPHLWLNPEGPHRSILDLFGQHFVLLTGSRGKDWCIGAQQVNRILGTSIKSFSVDESVQEQFLNLYGINEFGAVLVRPDGFIGWRSRNTQESIEQILEQVLRELLYRSNES